MQELNGAQRTRRFFSGQRSMEPSRPVIPRLLLAGAADMKVGSALLRDLSFSSKALQLDCRSYFCHWDLMVCPYWTAKLPYGDQQVIDVWTHQQLMSHPRALGVFRKHLAED